MIQGYTYDKKKRTCLANPKEEAPAPEQKGPTLEECSEAKRKFDKEEKVCSEKCLDPKKMDFSEKLQKCVSRDVEVTGFKINIKSKKGEVTVTKKTVTIKPVTE